MPFLHACVHYIDAFTDRSGRLLAWLALGMALVTALIVVLRYGFNIGSIAAQEAVIYVRVDIFYRDFSPRARAWVNSLGSIVFLLPLCTFICFVSWSYVAESWAIREVSPEPGGIPAVFLLKSLIPLMAFNLFLQGLAETLRSALVLVEEQP